MDLRDDARIFLCPACGNLGNLLVERLKVVEAPRPDPENEDRVTAAAYRAALDRIDAAIPDVERSRLGLVGCYSMTAALPSAVEALLAEAGSSFKVLRPGVRVRADGGDCDMLVVSVLVHGRGPSFFEYGCEWWDDGVLRAGRFDAWRLEVIETVEHMEMVF
jgi:hypothetical protein